MARIAYADIGQPSLAPLVERVRRERGSVLHLYQMLLHSPPVASGWLGSLTAIRQQTLLPGAVRELVIMRVALLDWAPYEAEQHRPIALQAGITEEQLDALADWRRSPLFDEQARAVLALTDAMTLDIQVPDEIFDRVRSQFDDRGLVELVATIAAYNMVSRFLEALCIHGGAARP